MAPMDGKHNLQDITLIRLLFLSGALDNEQVKSIQADYKNSLVFSSKPLEERLVSKFGVDKHAIDAVKRACWEENNFGKVLEAYLKETGALNKENYVEFKSHLEICAEEQKAVSAEGNFPPGIGELMVKRGWLSNQEINLVLNKQGTINKIKGYMREEGLKDSILAKQGFVDEGYKIKKGKLVACSLVLALATYSAWKVVGPKPTAVDAVLESVQEQSESSRRDSYSAMVQASYSNMLEHVKRKEFDKAQDNLDEIDSYFSYINRNDPDMRTEDLENYSKIQIIVDKTEKVNLRGVEGKDIAELRKMKPEELEKLVIE